MSYFFAGYKASASAIAELKDSMIEVVPPELRNNVWSIEKANSFVLDFGPEKAIDDIVLDNARTGSWLAILGTPLVSSRPIKDEAALLDMFFSDPGRMIKEELDGCFAVLAHDARTDAFYAATDYNNTTPIYYAATSSGLYLSSHELPLARFLQSEINPLGFDMTIQMLVTWGSYTRFENIRKLLPSEMLIFRGIEKCVSERYWMPSEEARWPADFDEAIDRWLAHLKKSVQAYYVNSKNNRIICDMTAGEDARLILSQCHEIGIPFFAMVDGFETDVDVLISKEAARKAGFDLVVRPRCLITEEQLLENATYISLMNDAYQDYFGSCTAFATNTANPLKNWEFVKLCGAPGGEAYRGSYYLRGRAFFPSSMGHFDYRFFTRMKWLLDFYPGLMRFPDEECKSTVFTLVKDALDDVPGFPMGIKIDHLLRVFQTCSSGLIFKNPRYLPFATKRMTGTVYSLPPIYKRGGKLTKACTEILFPELAFVKDQKGVPTVRKTLLRTHLFMPEYLATARSIASGAASRLLKVTESNKSCFKWNTNAPAITALLNRRPYADWFASSKSMITGHLYHQDVVDSLIANAKAGSTRYVPILGRIFNQEIACRWVYRV